jgi:hypothetical protein
LGKSYQSVQYKNSILKLQKELFRFPKSEITCPSGTRWYKYKNVRSLFEISDIRLKNEQLSNRVK